MALLNIQKLVLCVFLINISLNTAPPATTPAPAPATAPVSEQAKTTPPVDG